MLISLLYKITHLWHITRNKPYLDSIWQHCTLVGTNENVIKGPIMCFQLKGQSFEFFTRKLLTFFVLGTLLIGKAQFSHSELWDWTFVWKTVDYFTWSNRPGLRCFYDTDSPICTVRREIEKQINHVLLLYTMSTLTSSRFFAYIGLLIICLSVDLYENMSWKL